MELPRIVELDKNIYCPNCNKWLAYGKRSGEKKVWMVMDNEYSEDWGGTPVEIINGDV